ncbi:histone deacetylase 11 isoform X7 [Canis lupus baileyi]|uniref:histone deacetylase 11 isoform X7 n=1 Tax=Canis lupus dingo TaxID=286419 RepID=UPI0015F12B67|nr:histone deacetylase 11 isoform X7 [Canis lupus dingo]XP_038282743.1 histone deacetylase 11 isoform X6 [Canis lupus familiaris]XP_038311383.1 histone deacetylase 11 isoform X6 [Canis lupus familiaris]XP_038421451.1 histone deacetylase 11 isoform X6 [Canis lupus familiaris]
MPHTTQLYQHVPETRWPIVYSPRYNITFMGLEKLHPFDAGKWGKVISFLKEEKLLSDGMLVEAREASDEDLLVVHTRRYLNELKWSFAVATITEIPPVIFLPNFLVQRKVLKPLRTQTGGTIMVEASTTAPVTGAGASAPTRTSHWPSSFCSSEWRASPEPPSLILMPIRAMDMNGTSWVTSVCTSWMSTTGTSTLGTALPSRPSGGRWSWNGVRRMMSTWIKWSGTCRRPSKSTCPTSWCTTRGIVKRDELVFRVVRGRQVPILMVTSGGYQKRTARIIADSILNLYSVGLIGSESPSLSAQNSDTPLLPPEVP